MRIFCGQRAAGLSPVSRHREPPQRVRQHASDGDGGYGGGHGGAPQDEIVSTTFGVPVGPLILVTGADYQEELDEISCRVRALDPAVMSDEQFDEQVRRLRAERDRLKALPAEPDRWDEQLTGEPWAGICQALPASERGAWLTSHGFVVHATKKEVSVIQGNVRGIARLG